MPRWSFTCHHPSLPRPIPTKAQWGCGFGRCKTSKGFCKYVERTETVTVTGPEALRNVGRIVHAYFYFYRLAVMEEERLTFLSRWRSSAECAEEWGITRRAVECYLEERSRSVERNKRPGRVPKRIVQHWRAPRDRQIFRRLYRIGPTGPVVRVVQWNPKTKIRNVLVRERVGDRDAYVRPFRGLQRYPVPKGSR